MENDDKPSAEIESLIVDALKNWDSMYYKSIVDASLEHGLISRKRVNELIRVHELFRDRLGDLSDEVEDVVGRWFECL